MSVYYCALCDTAHDSVGDATRCCSEEFDDDGDDDQGAAAVAVADGGEWRCRARKKTNDTQCHNPALEDSDLCHHHDRLDDVDLDEGTVQFVHRPSTGTPLKNKRDGERLVAISDPVVDALRTYRARERFDKRDDHGRAPFFCARQGRPSFTTIRAWSYLATQPCLHTSCPHGRARSTCDYVHRNHASKCPSSRSPHPVRTGSITWQLNRGLSVEVVAARVNASPATIRRFYDKQSDREEFEERRREVTAGLDVLDDGGEGDDS